MLYSPAPPGPYRIKCSEPVQPARVDLGSAAEQFLALTIDRPGVVQTIQGRLVDTTGAVLAGRGVTAETRGHTWTSRTDARGWFVLERRADEPTEPVRLGERLEYEKVWHPEPVRWGTRGLIFVVPVVALDLRVVDGATGSPVERFGVRIVPVAGAGVGFTSSRRLRAVGDHPGGRARLTEVLPGDYMLSVETANARYVPTAYRPLHVGTKPSPPVVVDVWPSTSVTCLVAGDDGAPSAGSRVELFVVAGGRDGDEPRQIRPSRDRLDSSSVMICPFAAVSPLHATGEMGSLSQPHLAPEIGSPFSSTTMSAALAAPTVSSTGLRGFAEGSTSFTELTSAD